ncbi:uncharacterized protein [Panulirus ornatus]|uniref:uncharacterized protein n=1 Tax=Panulirus ornatus TaxID=150431 RepID=UPI003A854149
MADQTVTPPNSANVESSVTTCCLTPSSYIAVKESLVKEVLRLDKGDGARLLSWTVEDVSDKGSGYISDITSVRVKYSKSTGNHEVTYIVKLKKKREDGIATDMDNITFNKEGYLFTEFLPLMNAELTSAGLTPLQSARCYLPRWEEGENQIFLEDLRSRGFKVPDRTKPMDMPHATLVLQELAKLHAASHLLQERTPELDLAEKFKFLTWEWYNYTENSRKNFHILITGSLTVTSGLAKAAGYENASKWFEETAQRATSVVEEQLASNRRFDAVCHGDCCVQNLMFRYNDEGEPVEVMLLDFQVCRKSSLATDLVYFILTSLDEPERTANLDELLLTYHNAFKAVVEAGGVAMPYTPNEIKQEYHKKSVFGVMMASILIPLLVGQTQEIPDFDSATGGRSGEYVKQLQQHYAKMLEDNPLLRPRLGNLFEAMSRFGIID